MIVVVQIYRFKYTTNGKSRRILVKISTTKDIWFFIKIFNIRYVVVFFLWKAINFCTKITSFSLKTLHSHNSIRRTTKRQIAFSFKNWLEIAENRRSHQGYFKTLCIFECNWTVLKKEVSQLVVDKNHIARILISSLTFDQYLNLYCLRKLLTR